MTVTKNADDTVEGTSDGNCSGQWTGKGLETDADVDVGGAVALTFEHLLNEVHSAP